MGDEYDRERAKWIAKVVRQIEKIKPGASRRLKELLKLLDQLDAYDALIARGALKTGADILPTWHVRDFTRFGTLDAGLEPELNLECVRRDRSFYGSAVFV